MKPVVSLVAAAIAIAPLTSLASVSDKPATIEEIKPKPHKPRPTKARRAKRRTKPRAVHHASSVDFAVGHQEPRVSGAVTVVPASLAEKTKSDDRPAPEEDLASLVDRVRVESAAEAKGTKAATRDVDTCAKPALKSASAREPAKRSQEPVKEHAKDAKEMRRVERECHVEPIDVLRGPELDRFPLVDCDGKLAPHALDRLSISVRPGSVARPLVSVSLLSKKHGKEIAPGVRRVDPGLLVRLQSIIAHFKKDGWIPKLAVISGYRPNSSGSLHANGRAIDFRLEGVKNEDVIAFCKSLPDTGCGFYPNSSFVHLDVRDRGAGHVNWIDASGPGESPRYVSTWPPPARHVTARATTKPEAELVPFPDN